MIIQIALGNTFSEPVFIPGAWTFWEFSQSG